VKYYYQIEGLRRNNLGDVLQGLAAQQFLPNDAIPVDREMLSLVANEPGFLIGNGWYQHEFDKFPPPPNITPFYISVHIAKSDFLKIKNVRDHFKLNAPIGCRDIKTLWLLRGFGVPAYYSSCLTLTFKNRNLGENLKDEIIWVDNIDHPIPKNIEKKILDFFPNGFTKISHDPLSRMSDFESYVSDNIEFAKQLIERYNGAKLVLTTKIHCALPCIGMGVPVILIHPNPADPRLSVMNNLISIISYDDLLNLTELPNAEINLKKSGKIKNKLSNLVNLAVKSNKNPFTNKSNLNLYNKFKLYIIISNFTSFGLKTVYKIGFFKQTFERVFGKEYLIG